MEEEQRGGSGKESEKGNAFLGRQMKKLKTQLPNRK